MRGLKQQHYANFKLDTYRLLCVLEVVRKRRFVREIDGVEV